MDILSKIRCLLGGDKARKRKSEDTADDILRQFKEASTFSLRKSCKFDFPRDHPYQPLNKSRRYSGYSETSSPPMKKYSINNHLVSRESTSSHSSRESLNQFQSHLNNGGGHFMDEALATDQFYQTPRSYVPVPPLQPIQRPTYQVVQRQLPGLIKADHPVNGSYNHGHGHGPGYGHNNTQHQQQQQRHAMNGSIFNRQKLSQVPELYAIRPTQSRYNGDHYASTTQQEYPSTANNQQMPQPMYHNNHSAPQRSLRQNVNDLLRENGLYDKKQMATDKSSYRKMLDMLSFPFTKSKPKSSAILDQFPEPQEVIDLNDDEYEPSVSNASFVEPVNTLKTRMETKPLYNDKWLDELNESYSSISRNRAETLRKEKESSTAAERATRELEGSFLNRMKLLDIDSVYDLSDEQEPEFNDFPALNDDHMKKVNQWFYGRDLGVQLNAKFNLTITRHDIQTLSWEPLAWLNDEVINFYMELISERSRDDENLPNVHAMNTFFLQRLFDSGYSGVRRWTRKVDIFAQDIIPIPVHKGIHWCMAIIHMKNKTIKYYDSMGAPNNAVLNALVDYLKNESLDKKKVALDMSGWSIENVQDIPQQENGSDCGVFSCMYAEFVSRNRPFIFSQQHMQYFRKRMIYEICSGEML